MGIHIPVSLVTGTVCLKKGDIKRLGAAKITHEPANICKDKQKGAVLVGPVASEAYVCRTCACNAHNAICNRHGVKAKEVKRDFEDVLKYVNFDEVKRYYNEEIMYWESNWIKKWPFSKRMAILKSQAWDEIEPGSVKCMVKREVGISMPTKARAIQFYPNLATQAEFGAEFTALQKAYTKYFQRRRCGKVRITIASGLDSAALGRWMDEVTEDYGANIRFYERDGKNWDASMSEKHAEFRLNFYWFMGEKFIKFVQDCFKVKGMYRDKETIMKYIMEYTVKSGHNDTTLGNNLLNLAITFASCMNYECDIIVAGDDLLVAGLNLDGDLISSCESDMGITPEWRIFNDPCDVSFVSGIFARGSKGFKFVPKPGRLLAKLFWTVSPPSYKKIQAYQRGIALGLLPTCGDMPVIGPWLRQFDKGKAIYSDRSIRNKEIMYGNSKDAGDLTEWFKERYGFSDVELDVVTEFLLSAGTQSCILKHPLIDRICEVDNADLLDRETVGKRGLTTLRDPSPNRKVRIDENPTTSGSTTKFSIQFN